MNAIVSIHDCMPETMPQVEEIIDWLQGHGVPPVTLLVVPGRDWSANGIDRLRQLAVLGHPLSAHGWHHHTRPRRLFHRCHAALLSRNVAEHLDLDPPEIMALMRRSHDWFAANGLPSPDLYVPPAWALGPLPGGDLRALPFRTIETTRGVWLPQSPDGPVFKALPLSGYEADTPLRAAFLQRWNRFQARSARQRTLPLRISIHPNDRQLRLADQLKEQILQAGAFMSYSDLSSA